MKRRKVSSDSKKDAEEYEYMSGFGNEFETECLDGALPATNNPQACPYGLYSEQLSGAAFTVPRNHQQRSWLYRITPSCQHPPMKPSAENSFLVSNFENQVVDPNQIRWRAFPLPEASSSVDFVQGLKTLGGAGSADTKHGMAIHIYAANKAMGDRAFVNSDGDFLIVPEKGALRIRTEFGKLSVSPGDIVVIPRGVRFSVDPAEDGAIRGYICEVFSGHFILPDLGPIGANGLANPKDFKTPVAWYEDRQCDFEVVYKFMGQLHSTTQDHSPYDVVAWRGNYVPYKYCLDDFVAVNSVTIEHMDPSIFTVLTCQSLEPGVAVADFVIFPPRWAVQTDTFRPPYYHRNCMSEFMGNIRGAYEAKPDGFPPGSGSLHSCMVGHGPDTNTFEKCSDTSVKQDPTYMSANDLAFMFETTYMLKLTPWGAQTAPRDENYYQCWKDLPRKFNKYKK